MSRVLFVDLIDTTASVRDPSCLLCFPFHVCFFCFLCCLAARSRAEVRISLRLYLFFSIILLIYSWISCAAEQALIMDLLILA